MKQRSVMLLAVVLTSICLWGCHSDENQKLAPAEQGTDTGTHVPPPTAQKTDQKAAAAPTMTLNPNFQDKTGTKAK